VKRLRREKRGEEKRRKGKREGGAKRVGRGDVQARRREDSGREEACRTVEQEERGARDEEEGVDQVGESRRESALGGQGRGEMAEDRKEREGERGGGREKGRRGERGEERGRGQRRRVREGKERSR